MPSEFFEDQLVLQINTVIVQNRFKGAEDTRFPIDDRPVAIEGEILKGFQVHGKVS